MPRRQRLAVYLISTLLWASGLLWLMLDEFFTHEGQFGRTPHPLESPVLLVHGILAIVSAYVLGWISARHVLQWWTAGLRRWTGTVFATLVAILSLSGFALFFLSSDEWQRFTKITHEALGAAIIVFAIQHWLFGRRSQPSTTARTSQLGSSSQPHS